MKHRFNLLLIRLLPAVACLLCAATCAAEKPGEIIAAIDFAAFHFVLHPTKPLLYATNYARGSVGVVDTRSFTLLDEIPIGFGASSITISPDGARVYAGAFSGVSMIDTVTHGVTTFPVGYRPRSLAYGFDDRLWMVHDQERDIDQIDAITGASSGPPVDGGYKGMLETTPDRRTLFYATSGASPVTLYQFDITGPKPNLVWQNDHGALGSDGADISISHDGTFLALAATGGNRLKYGYDIGVLSMTNKVVLGVFDVGPYPREITFSPDDQIAYVYHTPREINVFSVENFKHLETWRFDNPYDAYAGDMITDHSGKYLFVAASNDLLKFSTGREVVPEPEGWTLAFIALTAAIVFLNSNTVCQRQHSS